MVCYNFNHIKELGERKLIEGQRAGTDSNLSLQNPELKLTQQVIRWRLAAVRKTTHTGSLSEVSVT